MRRTHEGVTFEPGQQDCSPALNLWSGFAHNPKEGSVEPFLLFLREVICDRDEERYAYLVAWLAQLVQQPGKKPGTALVLRGSQGTGKTTFANMVRRLFGDHAIVLASTSMLVRNFNSHLFAKSLLILEEAAIEKKQANAIKDIITSDQMLYEPKGVDPFVGTNCLHLIICTNERKAFHSQHDERRYALFDVSETRKEDLRYFSELSAWYEHGGAAAILHYLRHYDWTSVDLRVVPRTRGLLEQKIESLDLMDRALYSMLEAGETGTSAPWGSPQPRTFFVDAVNEHQRRFEDKVTAEQVGRRLKDRFAELRQVRDSVGTRGRSWVLPPLCQARADFERYLGHPVEWEVEVSVLDGGPAPRVVVLAKP
jgi:hypothetical protein